MKLEQYNDRDSRIQHWGRSPLPFIGQKKDFLKEFIAKVVWTIPPQSVVVDLFGGSGLLSHCVKYYRPELRVICNDLDNFRGRLQNIPETNIVRRLFFERFGRRADNKVYEKLTGDDADFIHDTLNRFQGYDWITLSNMVSGCSERIGSKRKTFTNKVKVFDYSWTGYLVGVERACCDFSELIDGLEGKSVFWIVDPPYAERKEGHGTYLNKGYLSLTETVELGPFVYFRSQKQFIDPGCFNVYRRLNTNGRESMTDVMITNLQPAQIEMEV